MKKLLMILMSGLVCVGAIAQDYPAGRPITLLVPFVAGGPTDRVARDLADAMQRVLGGNPVIVENVGGAGAVIGTAKVARSKNDGYTLLVTHVSMATGPLLNSKLPYNYETDLDYLGMISEVPMTLVAKPQMQADNFFQLKDWMQKSSGQISAGTAGVGSASHICGLMLENELKIKITHVPYKGTGPAMSDLLGGQIDLMCEQTTNTISHIEAKKIKPYAVTTLKRLPLPATKDLPTLHEQGLKNFQVTIWNGLYAPKGLPKNVTKKLNDTLRIALKDSDFVKKQDAIGAVVISDKRLDPIEHKKFVKSEVDRYKPVFTAAGVQPE